MKQIAFILVLIAAALAINGGIVFGLHDVKSLVPAPENEAEDFLDLFRVRRHEQALSHVASPVRDSIRADSLAAMYSRIAARIGDFELESTTRHWMTEYRASASGVLKGRSGRTLTITFPMTREHGLWRIHDLRPLADAAH